MQAMVAAGTRLKRVSTSSQGCMPERPGFMAMVVALSTNMS
ncbi:hypothetical protein M0765_023455 [Variovorax sp. S2]|nr:hypothetical protein [Variovorax sp. S12S4]MCR8960576.1 hypothetical protein [Variovorax sp. S12S4]